MAVLVTLLVGAAAAPGALAHVGQRQVLEPDRGNRRRHRRRGIIHKPHAISAAAEGVPVGTVKSWLHRARTALAAQLTVTDESEAHNA